MRRLLGISLALALAAAAGCGGGDDEEGGNIPAREAEAIATQLDQIADQAGNGICGGAAAKAGEVREKIEALPQDVSEDVRTSLTDGVDRLEAAIENDCEQPETTTEETQPDTTEEAPPPTTTEDETEPTTTEETQPEETEEDGGRQTETEPPGDGGTELPGQGGGTGAPEDGD